MITELSSTTYQVVILLTVIIIKWLMSYFSGISTPWRFFSFYCHQLAAKVNRKENSKTQQVIAGTISALITLLPIIIILWLFADFIAVPMLWQAGLLYLALGGFSTFTQNSRLTRALNKKNKAEARTTLSPMVLRDVSTLSELGLVKASIEMQLLKIAQQLVTTGFYFLISGPLAAITYRLLLEMQYSWNIKIEKNQYFGKSVHLLVNIMQWLPIRLFAFTLLLTNIGKGFIRHLTLAYRYLWQLNSTMLLMSLALSLGCKLGGVAIYNEKKLRKHEVNAKARQPKSSDIASASTKLKVTIAIILVVLLTLTGAQQLSVL